MRLLPTRNKKLQSQCRNASSSSSSSSSSQRSSSSSNKGKNRQRSRHLQKTAVLPGRLRQTRRTCAGMSYAPPSNHSCLLPCAWSLARCTYYGACCHLPAPCPSVDMTQRLGCACMHQVWKRFRDRGASAWWAQWQVGKSRQKVHGE